jgi:hypothetical protein
MRVKILILLILALVAYGVISCTQASREKERAKEQRTALIKETDSRLFDQIMKVKLDYDADISWLSKLGYFDAGGKIHEFFSNEIEDAFLNKGHVLLFGGLDDINNFDKDSYEVTISSSSFNLEMMRLMRPRLKFKFICARDVIDSIRSSHKTVYRVIPGFSIQIAVVSRITLIEDEDYFDSDGVKRKSKLIKGECNSVMLSPQSHGFLRKSLGEYRIKN